MKAIVGRRNSGVVWVCIALVGLVAEATVAEPNLISWWKFDGDANDSAGSNDGILNGDPNWIAGQIDGALQFDGQDDYVDCGSGGSLDITDAITIASWVKRPNFDTGGAVAGKTNGNSVTAGYGLFSYVDGLEFSFYSGGWRRTTPKVTISANQWHHVAATFDGDDAYLYVDGEQKASLAYSGSIAAATGYSFRISYWRPDSPAYLNGSTDDVRVYDRALSAEEILQIYWKGLSKRASNPNPADGATGVDPNVILSWSPSFYAASHDVYFGTDFADVNDATTGSAEYMGRQDMNSWDSNNYAPSGLEYAKTYYWRIDEVNDFDVNSPWKGNVWSFETARPVIELSATQFDFFAHEGGANPAEQILGISNSGAWILNWEITEDCDWLTAEPNSGSSTGEVDDVNLSVDITGLSMGVYDCNLAIHDPNASNNPQIVAITLHIGDADGELHVPSEYGTIQEAIDVALGSDVVIVAAGTYTGVGNRNINFKGKAITVRSTDPEDPCVLATTVIDCQNLGRGFYFHSGEGPDSIVSGLTITRGKIYVNGSDSKGGGIYCEGSSPTIKNCTIINNLAYGYHGTDSSPNGKNAYGGGVYCASNSNLTLIDCTVSSNKAQGGEGGDIWCTPMSGCSGSLGSGGHGYGGGIYSSTDSSVTIIGCIIIDNSASGGSGGVYSESGVPIESRGGGWAWGGGVYCGSGVNIEGCAIVGNTARGGDSPEAYTWYARGVGWGGGIHGVATISDSTVIGNQVLHGTGEGQSGQGGGIRCLSGSSIINCLVVNNSVDGTFGGEPGGTGISGGDEIVNCTIHNNWSGPGPGGYAVYGAATTEISNCIVWGNDGHDVGGTTLVTYSCTEDVISGVGNIHSDPCFVSGPEGDYYLSQVAAGQAVDSPCVDAGSDTAANLGMDAFTTRTDQWEDAGVVDMGYHYPITITADIDENWYVNFIDFAILGGDWLECFYPDDSNCTEGVLDGDITRNYYVDMDDFVFLADCWLDCYVGPARNPNPSNDEENVWIEPVLSWSAGDGAIYHDVYFGTDGNSVADANHLSAEFMGTEPNASFDPCTLELDTKYYWRIDEVGATCVNEGNLWSFTTTEVNDPNFVSWWKFDGDADDSSGNNHGTFRGGASTISDVDRGLVLNLDGINDYVEVSDDESLDFGTGSFSIAAWIKVEGSANGSVHTIVGKRKASGDYNQFQFSVRDDSEVLLFLTYDGSSSEVTGAATISDGNWYHVAAVRNSNGTMELYVDGAPDNSTSLAVRDVDSDAFLAIGTHSTQGANYFNGLIDDVRIYDRVLSAEEIQQLYQEGL